jgi:hypothetical protein
MAEPSDFFIFIENIAIDLHFPHDFQLFDVLE